MNFKIGILDLGLNNLKSLVSFFKQFGETFLINSDKEDISKFNTLILPGNGKFKTGMDIIKTKNLPPKSVPYTWIWDSDTPLEMPWFH